ncbi:DnaJ domain-containing protein [Sphingobium phenoxybenzoativorans]|uniref:DnaJ domain-containing protein n=1 Tax=Sphingobium phenoxybenzoativorans TaxID=1592790 RepID=A0A975K333_9SPHN|nr:DnaJ domain-containing protein [Sphingobium phenoxybenzoativorans]QUT04013.1 DnaJ domain-containing protein [Sphingobium phenoxybenzoativorans]
MTVPAYPLQWPDGLPRTERKATSQFKTGLSTALKNVKGALEAFARDSGRAVTDIVLSSNVGGLALETPKDTGVAAWFTWDGEQRCIAVDRYPKPEDNLQAIYHILEARRTEIRHGGLHIVRQTFKGFTALPAPEPWHDVLGVSHEATNDQINAAFNALAKKAHPDMPGGSADWMARLNAARARGLK